MLLVSFIFAFFLCCLLIPSVLASIIGDDSLDAHDYAVMRVSSRNPVREAGPPACMAKLIMMRHRLNQTNTKKRSGVSTVLHQQRKSARTALPVFRTSNCRRNLAWMRFQKHLSEKQY